ncbi:MAG: PaaI family thioesterase [Burkholderiaceae bacterium]|nr:PaaI family thioesterase [Burkholderiaceae bacterium]
MSKRRHEVTLAALQARAGTCLPGLFGLEVLHVDEAELLMRMAIQPQFLAPNGFLHAASVIALADTACGFATVAHLPPGAESFTTVEVKSNFLGTARDGSIDAIARAAHIGRTTQVWDATVTDNANGRTIALFRCTQMILWPKGG